MVVKKWAAVAMETMVTTAALMPLAFIQLGIKADKSSVPLRHTYILRTTHFGDTVHHRVTL